MSTDNEPVLPYDVLDLVLKEASEHDHMWFRSLRVVCKDFNTTIEPIVFASLTIQFSDSRTDTTQDLLTSIISRTSPFVRWANRLVLHTDLVGMRVASVSDGSTLEDTRRKVLETKRQRLSLAVRALEGVTVAIVHSELAVEVLHALNSLPSLHRLELNEIRVRPLANAVSIQEAHPAQWNLESLVVRDSHISYRIIRSMIRGSPGISNLELDLPYSGHERVRPIALEQLFIPDDSDSDHVKGDLQGPYPPITRLAITNVGVLLNHACVPPLLRSLTSLQIRRAVLAVSPSFWKALADEGVRLRSLDTGSLDSGALDYLLSYSGLEELQLKQLSKLKDESDDSDGEDEIWNTIRASFPHRVLAKHSATLKRLQIRPRWYWLSQWCWAKLPFETFANCKLLEVLDIVCYFPSPNVTPEANLCVTSPDLALTSLVGTLPNLRSLTIYLHFVFPHYSGGRKPNPSARGRYAELVLKSALSKIAEIELVARRPPGAALPPTLRLGNCRDLVQLNPIEVSVTEGFKYCVADGQPQWEGDHSNAERERMAMEDT